MIVVRAFAVCCFKSVVDGAGFAAGFFSVVLAMGTETGEIVGLAFVSAAVFGAVAGGLA